MTNVMLIVQDMFIIMAMKRNLLYGLIKLFIGLVVVVQRGHMISNLYSIPMGKLILIIIL